MIILESTKVFIDNLPKEEWWNSSLFTSIFGSFCGGIAAFLGIIWQMNKQRKLEIKKMKAELEIQNLEFQDKLLRDLDSVLNTYCLTYLKTNSFESNFDNSDSPIPKKTETIINCLYPEIRATLIVDNSVSESNVCKLISKLDNFLDGSSDTIVPFEAAECRNLISEIFKENAQKKRNIIDSIQK